MTADRTRPAGPTAYDRRMYTLMNRREGQALHATAARRRAVVVTHVVLTLLGSAAWIAGSATGQKWPLYVLLGLLLPWCLATGLINGATRGLLELRGRVLDERQLAERDQVFARAHRATTGVLAAAVAVTLGVGGLADARVEALVAPVLVEALVVQWLMPLWIAGLTVKDEPADETDPLATE